MKVKGENMGIYFSISGIVFLIIFITIFFSKKNTKNIETKIYGSLLIITFIGTIIDIIGYILYEQKIDINTLLYKSVAKSMLVYFISWATLFFKYTYSISSRKVLKINNITLLISYAITLLITLILPIKFNIKGNVIYPYGNSVSFTYIIITIVD